MPLDTCITNVGEYYSSHYLDSTFSKDLTKWTEHWKSQGSQAAPRRLQALGTRYFQAKSQALDVEEPARRSTAGDYVAGWHAHLLQALGYTELTPFDMPVDGGHAFVSALGRVQRYNRPWLVVCETYFCLPEGSLKEGMPSEDPLEMAPDGSKLVQPAEHKLCDGDWSRCLERVFTEEDAPRWVLFLAGSQLLLLDRNTFSQGRYLAFDLDDCFGRKERDTFNHVAAFLSAETLCPGGESDEVLHDAIEQQSHRFAHSVTESLQFAVREAIELLVNEWADDRTGRQKLPLTRIRPEELRLGGETIQLDLPQRDDGSYEITAEHLKTEALNFVYRLLFCFYAEARSGELEILPIDEDTYRLGYSLESLRDLEQVPLTAATEGGTYVHEHLKKLFQLIHDGFHPESAQSGEQQMLMDAVRGQVRSFTMRPLTATLFAPSSTPLLNRARLSNRCLQAVIRKLSLSVDDRSRTIGRVSYAKLGINQLGAVHEGLLSYKGMFADRELIHVKPASGDFRDKKTPTWFVPRERLEEFKKDEVERLEGGKPRIYVKGTFILHLNGIDREQSASYYTPEVLTKCLVEEALRELLKDYGPADADRILDLKICEPAMGSGAFLNEAAEQLAQRYLELKQKQIDQTIEPGRFGDELRRVKHYITTRNVYGVDLNATAVELGALSLWLGSIHRLPVAKGENGGRDRYQPGATPWFGLRLRCGNSLIGARRAVWTSDELRQGKHYGKDSAVPRLLKPGEARAGNEVYQFLVFDEDMVPTHTDKLMREFWPERCAKAKEWLAKQVKRKWDGEEIEDARSICKLIDDHWNRYASERGNALRDTACTSTVWPTPPDSRQALAPGPSLEAQETIKATLESASGSFQRLKLVMDSWCSLWSWPLDRVLDLPTRVGFLASARLLLGAEPPKAELRPLISSRLGFEIDGIISASEGQVPDTGMLSTAVPWYAMAKQLEAEQHFNHWELVLPEVLGRSAQEGGFDLIIGNPPWIKAGWTDAPVLCELDPILGVRESRSATFDERRRELIGGGEPQAFFCGHFRQMQGLSSFLNSRRNYVELVGIQTNLYKNFIARSWSFLSESGIVGLLHPEGIYNDARGGSFRREVYPRLRAVYQFSNELGLFEGTNDHGRLRFCLNIYGVRCGRAQFESMCNLYHPRTILGSILHDRSHDPVPGIKNDNNEWNIQAHRHRLVTITEVELRQFADLFEDTGTPPLEARLPQIHARELLDVVSRLIAAGRRLKDLDGSYFTTVMFDETYAQRDGIITRQDNPSFQPQSTADWVLARPHFYLGNPFAATPRTVCTNSNHFDPIDLTDISESYVPRAVFRPGNASNDASAFVEKVPRWPDPSSPITQRYRYVNRRRLNIVMERTLQSTIIPPHVTHINPLVSVSFANVSDLVSLAGVSFSLLLDFFLRITGKSDIYDSTLSTFPLVGKPYDDAIAARVLRLTCLSRAYERLWVDLASTVIPAETWSVSDSRLCHEYEADWHQLSCDRWDWLTPLRSDFARRHALLEIDVLVALGFGVTVAELVTVYRVQFPVFRHHENLDKYDKRGRRIPNTTRADPGGRNFRDAFEVWKSNGNDPSDPASEPLTVSWPIDDGLQTVTKTFYPPFTNVDREADYARAYEAFQQRYDTATTP